ncbi:MAG: LysE family transporter [Rhodospirillales bacterium]|nr:LysE family transporter [Rhodospirillales bacterium]
MEHLASFAGIAVVLLFVAMSPGPAFIVVSQQAVARSRGAGLVTALGVSVGSILWVGLVLLGISVVFQQATWLYAGLRLVGGVYLVYLGVQLWRGARRSMVLDGAPGARPLTPWRGFRRALAVQMLNPKAAVFFGSVFLTMLPAGVPGWVVAAALVMVFVIEFGWYATVALALSSPPARRAYAGAKAWIERVAGAWLALFGVKLALSSR